MYVQMCMSECATPSVLRLQQWAKNSITILNILNYDKISILTMIYELPSAFYNFARQWKSKVNLSILIQLRTSNICFSFSREPSCILFLLFQNKSSTFYFHKGSLLNCQISLWISAQESKQIENEVNFWFVCNIPKKHEDKNISFLVLTHFKVKTWIVSQRS